MVYAEATIAMPLIVSYAYHTGGWKNRKENRFNDLLK
jgi:deoxyhypusine synthase